MLIGSPRDETNHIADLGPEFVYEALRTDVGASAAAAGRSLRFLANVDPVDVGECGAKGWRLWL